MAQPNGSIATVLGVVAALCIIAGGSQSATAQIEALSKPDLIHKNTDLPPTADDDPSPDPLRVSLHYLNGLSAAAEGKTPQIRFLRQGCRVDLLVSNTSENDIYLWRPRCPEGDGSVRLEFKLREDSEKIGLGRFRGYYTGGMGIPKTLKLKPDDSMIFRMDLADSWSLPFVLRPGGSREFIVRAVFEPEPNRPGRYQAPHANKVWQGRIATPWQRVRVVNVTERKAPPNRNFFNMLKPEGEPERHQWNRIEYPPIPIPNVNGQSFTAVVRSGQETDSPRLRFDLVWRGPRTGPPDFLVGKRRSVVRLHMPNGKIVDPNSDSGRWIGVGSDPSQTWSRTLFFAWGANHLDEAWFEIPTIADSSIWLEAPYGMTHNPADAVAATSNPHGSGPKLARAMSSLPKNDRIVAWDSVEYDILTANANQDERRLIIRMSNSPGAECRIRLLGFPDRGEIPMSLAIEENGRRTKGVARDAVGKDRGMSGTRTFTFGTAETQVRDWGRLSIRAGNEQYRVLMPSSVFRSGHGVSEATHPARVLPAQGVAAATPLDEAAVIKLATPTMTNRFPGISGSTLRAKLINGVWHVYGEKQSVGAPEARVRHADRVLVRVFLAP